MGDYVVMASCPFTCPRCGRSDTTPVLMQWFDDAAPPREEAGCTICFEEATT